jgi:hypothetical protein
MQQGRFPATGMMIHHPHTVLRLPVAILITDQVGHFWKADPGHFSKAPKDSANSRFTEESFCLWTGTQRAQPK